MDIVSKEKRSEIMSGIRGKNTIPEKLLRRTLFKDGLRYRLHYNLPGKPDIVFPSKKTAIFVNGCFWHDHGCSLDHNPKTNNDFWKNKKERNKERDLKNYKAIKKLGWKYYIAWECMIYHNLTNEKEKILNLIMDKNEQKN